MKNKNSRNKKIPLVCILIVNWNGEKIVYDCLDSLKKTLYKNLKIIVIDNGSSDKSLSVIKKFKDVELITLRENIGYAPAINFGWNYCLKKYSPKYICNMNNDIKTIQKEWLNLMVDELEKEEKRAICSNKTISKKGFVETQHFDSAGEGVLQKEIGQYDFVREVETVGGAIFLVKKNLIDKIGGLDENFFFGADDRDYCLRAKKEGFKIIFNGFSKSMHLGSFSYKISEKNDIYKHQSYAKMVYSFRYDSLQGKIKIFLTQLLRTFITKKNGDEGNSVSNMYWHRKFFQRIIIFINSFASAIKNYKKIKQDIFKYGIKKTE
ncbi:MAG: glycosyltransferase [archaeon]|nr:glycosyltransferase [archaeon]